MAERRTYDARRRSGNNRYGVNGNAAYEAAPVRRRKEIHRETIETSRSVENRRNSLKRMSFIDVLMCLVLACVVFSGFVMLINYQNRITEENEQIAELKKDLANVVASNDELEYNINSSIDYEEICQKAESELGMVVASKDQVYFYTRSSDEYMKQVKDVPVE